MKIAVGGSAANPPHLGHQALLLTLLTCGRFDTVIWIISGFREDKTYSVTADDRVAMTELLIPKSWHFCQTKLIVKYDDVYGQNTPTIERLRQLRAQYPTAEICWYTGVDSVVPQKRFSGRCSIEAQWHEGSELMRNWQFLVLPRQGYSMPQSLPANFKILDVSLPNISSSEIRDAIRHAQTFEHLVGIEVANYIKRFHLYGYQ